MLPVLLDFFSVGSWLLCLELLVSQNGLLSPVLIRAKLERDANLGSRFRHPVITGNLLSSPVLKSVFHEHDYNATGSEYQRLIVDCHTPSSHIYG
jgi:hypothetical protein